MLVAAVVVLFLGVEVTLGVVVALGVEVALGVVVVVVGVVGVEVVLRRGGMVYTGLPSSKYPKDIN